MERNSPVRRCAVYTRKSSEEGLEQNFNSLHAQREACEAFIKSQQNEGWRVIKTAYDDGGLSGATMERPALQRLLSDIREGHIDVVVVYKVDRLTRSLADFAKMVESFDAHGVSFVAVTQHFNTTTSMGRLTLNVLLSFAQFEREVTGERIRDKIAASKRKGIWMGGIAPLGYDVRERRLVVNHTEAETLRDIFRRYLELGSVRLLKAELDRRGIRSKVRVAQNGSRSGGQLFSRGALYELLANPVYVGEIRHKGVSHPGQHQAIVERAEWERTQRQLREHAVRRHTSTTKVVPSPLTGKLFDQAGERLTPSHALKGGRRYRYYVSRSLMKGTAGQAKGWRLPAAEIERSVTEVLGMILEDPSAIAATAEEADVAPSRFPALLEAARASRQLLASEADAAAMLAALVERVELREDGMRLSFRVAIPIAGGDDSAVCERGDSDPFHPDAYAAPRGGDAAGHRRPRCSNIEGRPGPAEGGRPRPSLVRRAGLRPGDIARRDCGARRRHRPLCPSPAAVGFSGAGDRRDDRRGAPTRGAYRADAAHAHRSALRLGSAEKSAGHRLSGAVRKQLFALIRAVRRVSSVVPR